MATETVYDSITIDDYQAGTFPFMDVKSQGGRKRTCVGTAEATAGVTAGSGYILAILPSHARIFGSSTVFWDDLDAAGAPTLDVGITNPPNRTDLTEDQDAINNGFDCTSAGSAALVADIADYGEQLWALAGLSADPGGNIAVGVFTADAAISLGGTITAEIDYAVD